MKALLVSHTILTSEPLLRFSKKNPLLISFYSPPLLLLYIIPFHLTSLIFHLKKQIHCIIIWKCLWQYLCFMNLNSQILQNPNNVCSWKRPMSFRKISILSWIVNFISPFNKLELVYQIENTSGKPYLILIFFSGVLSTCRKILHSNLSSNINFHLKKKAHYPVLKSFI